MLLDGSCIGDVMAELRDEDFHEGFLRDAFSAIRELFSKGEPVDALTCISAMGKSGRDPEIRDALADILEETPTAANVSAYVRIVKAQSRIERLRAEGLAMVDAADEAEARGAVERMEKILSDDRSGRGIDMNEAMKRFCERAGQPREYVRWGISFLDAGLYTAPGDLVILAGHPSDGKTALSLQTACFQAEGKRVGYFSLETGEENLTDRIVCHMTGVSYERIKTGDLTQNDCRKIAEANRTISLLHLELIPASGWSVQDIQSYSRAHRFEIVYIDYLQLLKSSGKSRVEEVTNISMELHRLSQGNRITVIALSQLSRAGKDRNPAKDPPRMSDLRESGQIEQDADAIVFVYREDPRKIDSRRFINVAKNKEGKIGEAPFLFDGNTQTFTPEGADAEPEYRQDSIHEVSEPSGEIPF
jgi:replicative DNA helicase